MLSLRPLQRAPILPATQAVGVQELRASLLLGGNRLRWGDAPGSYLDIYSGNPKPPARL